MTRVEQDLDFALSVTKERKSNKNKLSFSSSDNIELISKKIDVSGKDILTVLDSCDPFFCFYLKGAKNVDTYDNNRLTFYYYFLRLWTFNFLNEMYPPRSLNYNFLVDVISNIKPKNQDEYHAYNFWTKFIEVAKDDKKIGMLLFKKRSKLIDYSKFDLGMMPYGINSINFFEGNIRTYLNKGKSYDIIYVSDKCDWINYGIEDENIKQLEKYRDNLYELLKHNGVVLCSFNDQQSERIIFENRFEYVKLPKAKDKGGNLVNCGYCYIKR